MTNAEKFKTAEQRAKAFEKWCKNSTSQSRGPACKVDMPNCFTCQFAWLDLEAEEEKILPCPFCGGMDLVIQDVGGFELECQGCGFHTPSYMDKEKLISEYLLVARAVMEAGKKEVTP